MKNKVIIFCISVFILIALSAYAQEPKPNVVVIPLNSSQKIAKSGQTFAGNISSYNDPVDLFELGDLSFPVPLPSGTATPLLECLGVGETSGNCPGIGQASPGYICVYGTFVSNYDYCFPLDGAGGDNRLYGYSVGFRYLNSTNDGWFVGSWAYQVP